MNKQDEPCWVCQQYLGEVHYHAMNRNVCSTADALFYVWVNDDCPNIAYVRKHYDEAFRERRKLAEANAAAQKKEDENTAAWAKIVDDAMTETVDAPKKMKAKKVTVEKFSLDDI